MVFAIPGFLWAVWFFVKFHNDPNEDPAVNGAELERIHAGRGTGVMGSGMEAHEATPRGSVFSNPAMGAPCGQQVFRAGGYIGCQLVSHFFPGNPRCFRRKFRPSPGIDFGSHSGWQSLGWLGGRWDLDKNRRFAIESWRGGCDGEVCPRHSLVPRKRFPAVKQTDVLLSFRS